MTTESQKARDDWYASIQRGKTINPDMAFEAGYQASEARIRAMLESGEMVKNVENKILALIRPKKTTVYFNDEHEASALTKAALKAIVEGIK